MVSTTAVRPFKSPKYVHNSFLRSSFNPAGTGRRVPTGASSSSPVLIPPLPRRRHWYPHPYKAEMTLPTSRMPHVVGPAIVRRQLDDAGYGVAAVEDSRDSGYDEGTDSREYEAGANHDRVHAVNHRLGA